MKKRAIVVFWVSLSYLSRAIGSVIMMGIIFFGYCLFNGVQQGVFTFTLSESLILIASALFLFWVSLRALMWGEELSEKT